MSAAIESRRETVQPGGDDARSDSKRKPQNHLVQGTSAAGARALGTQVIAFYFRAPVKAFFRARVDYLQVARALHPHASAPAPWTFTRWLRHMSTPALLAHSVRTYGWGFIPRQVLPPLVANATVGAVLYTSYLQVLSTLHAPSAQKTKRVYPPPGFAACFAAGSAAGAIGSVVAAPLDALVVRFDVAEMLGEHGAGSVWAWARRKLRSIGLRGVWKGYALSFCKESLGYGLFFASFEYVKQQSYFSYLRWYYGRHSTTTTPTTTSSSSSSGTPTIRPHYALEPLFLLLAGASASVSSNLIQHPLGKIQSVHYGRLESIDYAESLSHSPSSSSPSSSSPSSSSPSSPSHAHAHPETGPNESGYGKTLSQCRRQARKAGGWRRWLYRGFALDTLRQIPSTAAGLVVFEIVRRRWGDAGEGVVIELDEEQDDGARVRILLT